VVNPQTLTFEDFPGNNFFNTLGNIQSDRRVGLLFLDFTKNRLIQITAWASILWEAENRTIQLDLKRILINPNITLTQTPLEKAK
jgi:predicted pyridoxine 5'-phosphate oxidase superfamily flavin-nucleotide-binding protein